MKQDKTTREVTFICDNCEKKTKPIKEEIDKQPFPYSTDWIYAFRLDFKAFEQQICIKNKHFCCIRCLEEYIQTGIKQIKDRQKKK